MWRNSWAAAIVLFVNIFIFPVTSEKELRRTLNLSLEHIATFSHLLAKVSSSPSLQGSRPFAREFHKELRRSESFSMIRQGYTLELTEEEREVRAQLAQSIRVSAD
jgi:hypothetical protein